MPQHEIEVILIRQLASYLTMPIFIIDPEGTLIFYNEPAEAVLGRRFEESGEMPMNEWARAWLPTDEQGNPLSAEGLPLWIALNEQRPSYDRFWIHGMDHIRRCIEVVAIPLIGQAGRFLGAAAVYWESRQP